jgi:hypothetical protein
MTLPEITVESTVPNDLPDLRAPATEASTPDRPPRFRGTAADGLVTVAVAETGRLLGVHVAPGEYLRENPPGLANIGDMVVEALQVAKARAARSRVGVPTPPEHD